MPSVKVSQQSPLSPEECFKRVSKMLESDQELRRLDPKYSCQFDVATLSGTAEGKQFKAAMKITSASQGASIEINVDLPFHLAFAKGLVAKTLEKKLAQSLA